MDAHDEQGRDVSILPTRTCFDDSLDLIDKIVIANDHAFHPGLFLVHAICTMPNGELYAHAWVEFNDSALFVGILNGARETFKTAKTEFYEHYKPVDVTRYTVGQAMAQNMTSGHFGPWKRKYWDLCGNIKGERNDGARAHQEIKGSV